MGFIREGLKVRGPVERAVVDRYEVKNPITYWEWKAAKVKADRLRRESEDRQCFEGERECLDGFYGWWEEQLNGRPIMRFRLP